MHFTDLLHELNPWWLPGEGWPRSRGIPTPRRRFEQRLLRDLVDPTNRRAIVLIGPRQVGKTTALQQIAEDLLMHREESRREHRGFSATNLTYFDFSDDRLLEPVSPRDVISEVPAGLDDAQPRIFLFDEISKSATDWGQWLKHSVDAGDGRFVVTDSAASLLRERGAESGQGRWDELEVEGLSFREWLALQALENETSTQVFRRLPNPVERYLRGTGFPEHVFTDTPDLIRERLRSDALRAIDRDLARPNRDTSGIRRLFTYLAQNSGGIFEPAKIARALDVDARSVKSWIELLEDARLVSRLEVLPSPRHPSIVLTVNPKIYAVDHGLVAAFATGRDPLADPTTRGRLVETAVFRHLREIARDRHGTVSLIREERSRRRSRGRETEERDEQSAESREADFFLEASGQRIVIEVTTSVAIRHDKRSRLLDTVRTFAPDRVILVTGGLTSTSEEGVTTIPLSEFLLSPVRALLGVPDEA